MELTASGSLGVRSLGVRKKKNKKKRTTVTFDFPLSVKAMRQTG
ncbi:MAG: hypothetical protein Phog2KO_51270 [Phototrophicaceae bacterium]